MPHEAFLPPSISCKKQPILCRTWMKTTIKQLFLDGLDSPSRKEQKSSVNLVAQKKQSTYYVNDICIKMNKKQTTTCSQMAWIVPSRMEITKNISCARWCSRKEGRKINLPAQTILTPYWHPWPCHSWWSYRRETNNKQLVRNKNKGKEETAINLHGGCQLPSGASHHSNNKNQQLTSVVQPPPWWNHP